MVNFANIPEAEEQQSLLQAAIAERNQFRNEELTQYVAARQRSDSPRR